MKTDVYYSKSMRFRTLKEKNLTFWKGVGVKGQFIYKRSENRMALEFSTAIPQG